MIPITNEENESYEKPKVCYICKEDFSTDKNDKNIFKLYHKVRDHCHYAGKFREAAHSICNLRCKTSTEIPAVAHYATYDHHVIIKQLAKEFDGQFECLGENTEKHITFSVPIKKELDNDKAITYRLKFIDSFIFMSTHYQILFIIYLNFTKKNAKNPWKEKISNQNVILVVLKIINYIINVKNAEKFALSQ